MPQNIKELLKMAYSNGLRFFPQPLCNFILTVPKSDRDSFPEKGPSSMNITKRDVQELRKRLTKKACTFDRVTGYYINSGKEVVLRFSESFSNLEEDEFFKYLDLAKKVFSGSLGKNLLELGFRDGEEAQERQQFLQSLRSDRDCTDETISRFFDLVQEHYHAEGSYLVLLFHDIYDVPVRTKDRQKLDDSEEVYEYIVCAICPVDLSKPALGYREEENRIGARERDWVVGMPELGFVYPAFSDRSADIHSVLYYAKSDSHPELIEGLLCCDPCRTAAEEKLMFEDVVHDAFGDMEERAESTYLFIQRNLDGLVALREETEEGSGDLALTAEDVADVIADIEMPDLVRESILEGCTQMFGGELPSASHLVDPKLAAEGTRRAQILTLEKKISSLEEQLDEARGLAADAAGAEGEASSASKTEENRAKVPGGQIVLQLPPSKRNDVRTEIVEGKRCLVIPIENGETARVNGSELPLWEAAGTEARAEASELSETNGNADTAELSETAETGEDAATAESSETVGTGEDAATAESSETVGTDEGAATAQSSETAETSRDADTAASSETDETSGDTDTAEPSEAPMGADKTVPF